MDDEHLCADKLTELHTRGLQSHVQPLPSAIINILFDARVAVRRKLNEE
jgi:hypothetical protein